MPERVSSYGEVVTFWGERTEEGSCSEGKKASRINLKRKVGLQGDQSLRKLLQQHNRQQEIGENSKFF